MHHFPHLDLNLGHFADQLHIDTPPPFPEHVPAPAPANAHAHAPRPRHPPAPSPHAGQYDHVEHPELLRVPPASAEAPERTPCADLTVQPDPDNPGAHLNVVVAGDCQGGRVQLGPVPAEPESSDH